MIDDNKGYIANHWRGNLPLAQAFWLNSVLIPGAMVVLVTLSCLKANERRDASMVVPLILFAAMIVVSVWGLLGAFLSATRHVGQGGNAFWRNLAIAALVLNTILLALTPLPIWALLLASSLAQGRV